MFTAQRMGRPNISESWMDIALKRARVELLGLLIRYGDRPLARFVPLLEGEPRMLQS